MWPHFTGTIELGQVLMMLSILYGAARILTALDSLELEHEMLIDDYCERKHPGVPIEQARKQLLTRRRRNVFSIMLSGGRRD
jgi:hypothetical protein